MRNKKQIPYETGFDQIQAHLLIDSLEVSYLVNWIQTTTTLGERYQPLSSKDA